VRRAIVLLQLGDAAGAIADTSEAMRIEPKNVLALTVRGNGYRAKGDLKRAIDDYSAAILFAPSFTQAYHERGVAYRMKGDREDAITDFKMAVRQQPMDSPDSRAELKALGVEAPAADPLRPQTVKGLLDSLK
jgi:tetratricopeptide (TPR) repeat protein